MQVWKNLAKRYTKFGIVGLSGLLVNIGTAYILKNIFSIEPLLASSLAIEVSILNNFFWNSIWTWRDREREDIWIRLLKYHVAASLGAIINMGVDFLLLKYSIMQYIKAHCIGVFAGSIFNFFLNDKWTFNKKLAIHRWDAILFLFIGLVTYFEIILARRVELFFDEAYYWVWAQHLSPGYLDHPPFVAWIIYLSTSIFGKTEIGVRLPFILFSSLTTILVYYLAYEILRNKKLAFWSAFYVRLLPLFNIISILAIPDNPLFFFWSLYALVTYKAIKTGEKKFWYYAGIVFGFSLLTKYFGFFLPLITFSFIFLTKRQLLLKKEVYVSHLVGLLMFSPNILWNLSHGFASFKFQLSHGFMSGGHIFYNLRFLAEALLITVSPLALFASIWGIILGLYRGLLRKERRFLYISLYSAIPFLTFFFTSLKSRPEAHWPFISFIFSGIPVVYTIFLHLKGKYLRLFQKPGSHLIRVAISILILINFLLFASPLNASITKAIIYFYDRVSEKETGFETGFKQLAEKVKKYTDYPIITPNYHIASELAFYMDSPNCCIYSIDYKTRPSMFRFWIDESDFIGQEVIFITYSGHPPPANMFENPVKLEEISVNPDLSEFQGYTVYKAVYSKNK